MILNNLLNIIFLIVISNEESPLICEPDQSLFLKEDKEVYFSCVIPIELSNHYIPEWLSPSGLKFSDCEPFRTTFDKKEHIKYTAMRYLDYQEFGNYSLKLIPKITPNSLYKELNHTWIVKNTEEVKDNIFYYERKEGDSVEFECQLSNSIGFTYYNSSWFKEKSYLKSYGNIEIRKSYYDVVTNLRIDNLNLYDSGIYYCTNAADSKRKTLFYLNVIRRHKPIQLGRLIKNINEVKLIEENQENYDIIEYCDLKSEFSEKTYNEFEVEIFEDFSNDKLECSKNIIKKDKYRMIIEILSMEFSTEVEETTLKMQTTESTSTSTEEILEIKTTQKIKKTSTTQSVTEINTNLTTITTKKKEKTKKTTIRIENETNTLDPNEAYPSSEQDVWSEYSGLFITLIILGSVIGSIILAYLFYKYIHLRK